MLKKELLGYLNSLPRYSWKETNEGLVITDSELNTVTLLTPEAIERNTLNKILIATHQGRNIDHITRVTGYFSKTSGWNKGKIAELKDRHRTPLDKE